MTDTSGVQIAEYSPADSREAMELDRASPQGGALRLSFERSTFQRRAENFDEHHIVTARVGERLVGVGAVALKDAVLLGEPLRAAFYFDFRVDPRFRRHGIGLRLMGALVERVGDVGMGYSYVAGDNPLGAALGERALAREAGGYAYLVLPTAHHRHRGGRPASVPIAEVHAALLGCVPGFDFYTNPMLGGRLDGHVGSWLLQSDRGLAGCSAWDNRGILGEVVEDLPAPLRLAARATRRWPLDHLPLPHIPLPGEAIRSWYLFDAFATEARCLKDLVAHVLGEAKKHGVDYCYLIHQPDDPGIHELRQRLFAPVSLTIPYRMLAWRPRGEFPRLGRVYVDVRDV